MKTNKEIVDAARRAGLKEVSAINPFVSCYKNRTNLIDELRHLGLTCELRNVKIDEKNGG